MVAARTEHGQCATREVCRRGKAKSRIQRTNPRGPASAASDGGWVRQYYSAWSADAMPDPPHRRRTPSPRHQGLVDSTGRGAGRTTRDTDSNGPEDEERDATRLGNKPDVGELYFRRFLLAWRNHGHQDQLDAYVINYADDFVIRCRPAMPRWQGHE